MNSLIESYLDRLRGRLRGCDRATVQDALSDAEDHLTTALREARETNPSSAEEHLFEEIEESFGTPEEVAGRYMELEGLTRPALAESGVGRTRNRFLRFCSVLADPGAWGAVVYMLLSIVTGAIYFTWAVAGIYVSLALLILIIGLPVTWLFLLSFRGIALVEGRIVEGLLGIRMPRRAVYPRGEGSWWQRFRATAGTRSTWTSLLYMLMLLPAGIVYFTLIVSLLAVGLMAIADPVVEHVLDLPLAEPDLYTPLWLEPAVVFAGFMVVVLTMHLAKLIGRLHGKLAKKMLVS